MRWCWILLLLASCARPSAQPQPPPVKQRPFLLPPPPHVAVIMLDPGHGGDDYGANTVTRPRLYEKNLNLQTALLASRQLADWGYDVRLTRKRDIFVPLAVRAKMANGLPSKLFVSIHYNSAPNRKAQGIEIYYYDDTGNSKRTKGSQALGQAILRSMVQTAKSPSRGVRAGDLAVIRETTMPAVLVECAFLTNSDEAKQLRNPAHLQKLAYGIAKGIDEYLRQR